MDSHPTDFAGGSSMMQTAVKTKKPRKQAVSGCFWAKRTYRGRIKDDHKIELTNGTAQLTFHTNKKHSGSSSRLLELSAFSSF